MESRYDVRNLLDDQRLFSGPREIHSDKFLQETSDIDDERFNDLDSDEELLFDMDEDERQEHLTEKQREKQPSQFKGIQYGYGTEDKDVLEPTFQLHFEVPEGMAVVCIPFTLAGRHCQFERKRDALMVSQPLAA